MMKADFVECKNDFRCWECSENCNIKTLFTLPDPIFMSVLNNSRSSNIGVMMLLGLPVKEAEEMYNIKIMSLIVARKQYLESQK